MLESKDKEGVSFKKSLAIGGILGFAIAYIVTRVLVQLDDGTGIIAKWASENQMLFIIIVMFVLVAMIVMTLYVIVTWIKGGLTFVRAFKRFKRQEQIRKYRAW